jgi:hypothetical protein
LIDDTATGRQVRSDENDLLTRVRAAWADVLATDDVTDIPLDTNFLETAGSSLLLIMLWELLHVMTDRTLRVSDLFQHSTVRAQAALLAGEHDDTDTAAGGHDRSGLLGRARRDRSSGAPGEGRPGD